MRTNVQKVVREYAAFSKVLVTGYRFVFFSRIDDFSSPVD